MPKTVNRGSGKIAAEFCRKHPDVPSRTLARLLSEKHPQDFPTIERARATIRSVRGNNGKEQRKQITDKSLFRKNQKPFGIVLPKGHKQSKPPLHFEDEGKWLILSDLHIPYHDETAIEAAILYGVKQGCQHVVLNGDTLDFYQLSKFPKDPEKRKPEVELKMCRRMMAEIAKHFPGKKLFKVGNHEERWQSYLFERAEHMAGIKDFRLEKVLRLKSRGWEYIGGRQWYYLGHLAVIHGHELKGDGRANSPVNMARTLFLKTAENALCGHGHRASTHIESTGMKKRITTCYSTGCLCGLFPDYALINGWTQGFAIVEVGKGGTWNVSNCTITDGQVFRTE